jgi:hypothetical protein
MWDVIFYYPQHFNRSKNGTNPFFDPLIDLCKQNKLSYLLIEEPDRGTAFPRNRKAYRFDFYFYLILLLRKMMPLLFFKHFENREQWIGKVFKNLTLGKFSAKTVFTISNSMGGVLRGYCPNARIIDYQHGIISKKQPGFFINGQAPAHILVNTKEVAVWGKGFQKIFDQDKLYYENKVHVLGYHQSVDKTVTNYKSNKILFTLQLMPDFGVKLNNEMLAKIDSELRKINALSLENRPQIILRNHPRHNNAVDLNILINKFDFVSLMPEKEILTPTDYLLHVTFYSTTAFEMAIQGVPTYFLVTENIINGKTEFLNDYQYPINQNFTLEELWSTYKNDEKVWVEHSGLVKKWSKYFFEPFNKDLFLDLVKHD